MDTPNLQPSSVFRHHTFPALQKIETLRTNSSELSHKLRRVKSEIHTRGRWYKRILPGNDDQYGIKAAFNAANRLANAPLYGSLFHDSEPTEHSTARTIWTDILPTAGPIENVSISQAEDGLSCNAYPEQHENSFHTLLSPPVLGTLSRSTSRAPKAPPPIRVSGPTEYAHIQPYNPDQTQVIDPGTTPSSSPVALVSGMELYRRSTSYDIQEPVFGDIFAAVSNLGALISGAQTATRQETQDSSTSYQTAEQGCERKMLIIGSSYDKCTRQTSTQYSIASLESLHGTRNDVASLVSVFRGRGYSVTTMTHQTFDREQLLQRIAEFLDQALPGDVRALVFTGHSIRSGDNSPSMVLPGVSSDIKISAEDWNDTIRKHAKPGVIVLSILATCFSGAFVDQPVRITDFNSPQKAEDVTTLDTPVFITFSSCGPNESTFESSIGRDQPDCRDLFLWALVTAARNYRLQTWSEFMTMLHEYFAYARSMASTMATEGALEWLYHNRQRPMFAADGAGLLPDLRIIFPTKLDNYVAYT